MAERYVVNDTQECNQEYFNSLEEAKNWAEGKLKMFIADGTIKGPEPDSYEIYKLISVFHVEEVTKPTFGIRYEIKE